MEEEFTGRVPDKTDFSEGSEGGDVSWEGRMGEDGNRIGGSFSGVTMVPSNQTEGLVRHSEFSSLLFKSRSLKVTGWLQGFTYLDVILGHIDY